MKQISFACGSLGETRILEDVLRESFSEIDPKTLLFYSNPLGMPELRCSIAEFHGQAQDNIAITSSAQQALAIVFEQLRDEGRKTIFIQEPAYFGTIRLMKKYPGLKIPFESVEQIHPSSIVYLTSNFFSSTINQEEKIKLAEYAKALDLVVVEDNPYDLLYFGDQPTTIFELAPENTIYLNSFSKILAPGIRTGYVLAKEERIAALKSHKIDYDLFTSTLSQQVCLYALQNQDYLGELRDFFKAKRDLALTLLNEYFTEDVTWNTPKGGIFIFAKIAHMQKIVEIAQQKYALFLEKDQYRYLDGKSRNTTRINFVKNPDDLLKEGIERLHEVVKYA
jgi:2-aminoadipate transaminase